jgi:hypothetical protein
MVTESDLGGRSSWVVFGGRKKFPSQEEKVQVVILSDGETPREGGFGRVQLLVKVVLRKKFGS